MCTILLAWGKQLASPFLQKILEQSEQIQKASECCVRNCVKLHKIKQIWAGGNTLFYQSLGDVCTAGNLCSFIFVNLEVANVLMRSWRGKRGVAEKNCHIKASPQLVKWFPPLPSSALSEHSALSPSEKKASLFIKKCPWSFYLYGNDKSDTEQLERSL